MELTRGVSEGMDVTEVEFLAEKELVTIVPNFSENKICLISGDYGPFNPAMHTRVPLWLAINLRQRHKCRIEAPSWMSIETLLELKGEETSSQFFTALPSPHYRELATLLLDNAAEDIPRADEVRALVKDVWDLRVAKLRKSIDKMVAEQQTHGKLNNLTLMEINSVRPFLTQALDHAHFLRAHATQHAGAADSSAL